MLSIHNRHSTNIFEWKTKWSEFENWDPEGRTDKQLKVTELSSMVKYFQQYLYEILPWKLQR